METTSSFNDPFDCALSLLPIGSDEEVADYLRYVTETTGKSSETNIAPAIEREEMNAMLQNIEERISNAGVYCMSEENLSMLMWSHYADQHRGMCIEFERRSDNELGSSACKKVKYVSEASLSVEGLDFIRNPENVLNNALYTKLKDWKYEKEWRLVYFKPSDAKSLQRCCPLPGKIKSITFGERSSETDMNIVINASRLAMLDQAERISLFRTAIDRENGRLALRKMVWDSESGQG